MPRTRSGCWSPADSAVVVVSPKADGVQIVEDADVQRIRRVRGHLLRCRGGDDDVLIGATAQRVNQLALAAIGAYTAGLVAGALRLTADYVGTRQQFGKPLSTFQTVAAQLAEVYIASRTIDLASTSVIWRLAEGRDAADDLDVLGYWITSQAPRVMQICHHLHGGHGDGHHLPDAPVLLHDQRPDPPVGRAIASSRPGGSAMFIELTPEQRQLQAELRQYFSNLISSDEMKAMEKDRHNEAYRAVIKRMGQDGKLGVGWPKEFGGLGFGPIEQSIFVNEAHRADVPLPAVTLQTVGPVLQQFGTDLQKKKFLPSILAGELHFAIGYSEPEAGHRPGVAAHHRRAPWRRIHRQRPEDVDHRRARRRLHLAGLPHRPGSREAQGHFDPDRRHEGPGLLVDAGHLVRRRAPHQRHLLQRRPGARRHAGRRGERRPTCWSARRTAAGG